MLRDGVFYIYVVKIDLRFIHARLAYVREYASVKFICKYDFSGIGLFKKKSFFIKEINLINKIYLVSNYFIER